MVTIGSGGIPKLGGGMPAMDILKRLGMKRGMNAAEAGGFGAPSTPAAAVPQISVAKPPVVEDRPAPEAMLSVAPTESSGMAPLGPMAQGKRFSDPTILNRMGDFINSDRGRATLLRSGAATLSGGLGAGIKAGAEYYDDQKEIEAKQMNWVSEMGLKTRAQDIDQQQVDQTGRYQGAMADNASTDSAIRAQRVRDQARNEAATANIDVMEEGGRNARFDRGDATDRERIDVSREGNQISERNNIRGTNAQIYGIDSSRYTNDEDRAYQYGDVGKSTVGVGKRSSVSATQTKPSYDAEIRYDPKTGQGYRLDRFTGRPVPVGK